MRTKTYYIIKDDAWGQHGTYIEEVQLTKDEYEAIPERPNRNFFITDDYEEALYYMYD